MTMPRSAQLLLWLLLLIGCVPCRAQQTQEQLASHYYSNGEYEQAAELYDPEKVRVLESKTIGDGYAALTMFDPTLGTIDAVMANLDEAIQNVKTGMVSNSVRESHLNGLDIHEGDYIGICGKDVLSDAETLEGAAEGLLRQMSLEDCSVLICIKGKGIGDDTLEAVTQLATGMYPAIEVYPLEGGQDVYPLILVAES